MSIMLNYNLIICVKCPPFYSSSHLTKSHKHIQNSNDALMLRTHIMTLWLKWWNRKWWNVRRFIINLNLHASISSPFYISCPVHLNKIKVYNLWWKSSEKAAKLNWNGNKVFMSYLTSNKSDGNFLKSRASYMTRQINFWCKKLFWKFKWPLGNLIIFHYKSKSS